MICIHFEPINMNISVIYFSVLQKITGKRQEQIHLENSSNGEDLFELLAGQYPELNKYKKHLRLSVNREYSPFDRTLQSDDEVVFITPVSGG